MLGRDIKIGDYIVYPAVLSGIGQLNIAEVIELTEREMKDVLIPTLRVRAASKFREIRGQAKASTLSELGRVCKIAKTEIPQEWITEISKVPS